MKTHEFQQVLETAQLCANIRITLVSHATPDQADKDLVATSLLEHFVKNGLLILVSTDEANHAFVVAKTIKFQKQDAKGLAEVLAVFVSSVKATEIPAHSITLGKLGTTWQLKMQGGNKLLRSFFAALPDSAKKYCGLDAEVANNKNGEISLTFPNGDEARILAFSEAVARMFNVELVLE